MSAPVTGPEQRARSIARALRERLDAPQRAQVGTWARRLLEIRTGRQPPPLKAWRALDATSDAVAALLIDAGRGLVEPAWTDRRWPARAGIAAGGAALAAVAGAGAGVAAAGGTVAIPLWIVFGGGAPVARLLAEELAPASTPPSMDGERAPTVEDGPLVEAEWEWDAPRLASAIPRRTAAPGEPLWHVFRSAYRDARDRQRRREGAADAGG